MTLPSQTEQQMITAMTNSFGAAAGVTPVFQSGDVLLAIFQSVAVQIDFLQSIVQALVLLTRAQTSTGSDLDAWMAQFAFARLPATYAEGIETFAIPAAITSAIPIQAASMVNGVYQGGALVQTSNGGTVYQVIPNTANSAYNSATNQWTLAAGQTSVNVNVQAVNVGSASNVLAAQLTSLGSSVPGIASVTNASPINNGIDAETDTAFRARFILYLSTLAKATQAAIVAAAESVQQGLQITTVEFEDPSGNPVVGAFTLFVDDGSGNPPSQLITNVTNAVNATRAFGVRAYVSGPNITNVTIVITIRVAAGYVTGTVETAVKNAIVTYVSTLTTNQELYVSQVELQALNVAGVVSVQPGTTLNGSNADITPASEYELRTSTGLITVNTY